LFLSPLPSEWQMLDDVRSRRLRFHNLSLKSCRIVLQYTEFVYPTDAPYSTDDFSIKACLPGISFNIRFPSHFFFFSELSALIQFTSMDLFYIFIGLLPITKKPSRTTCHYVFFFPSLTFTGVTFLNMARYLHAHVHVPLH